MTRNASALSFENAYEGTPTWDVGRPQGAVVRLESAGRIRGSVLDVGCGTGDNALFLACRGHRVVGVDRARRAVDKALERAATADQAAEFLVWDAFELAELGLVFDTVLDVGLFHTLDEEDRTDYAASVRSVLAPGGRCLLICWSDRNPFGRGPSRISQRAIAKAFRPGWSIESIEEEELESRLPEGRVHAWLAELSLHPRAAEH